MRRRRSACSVNSDSSEIDIDLLAETELSKLQRQFRIMEGDRQAYSVESQDLIRRQLREIQRLHGEREELLRSLCIPFRCRDDADATQNLSSMLVYRDRVVEQLDSEQGKMAYLRQEILTWESKLAGQRRGSTTCHSQKSEANQTQKNSLILENKLDRGRVRFNKILAKNGQLREELKILHVERKQFLHLYCRMERELQEIRKNIRDMMAQSTAAFEARVEARCKRMLLKEKKVKDLTQYGTEVSELQRVISHDHRLKTFMSIKGNESSSQEEGEDLSRRQVEERQRRRLGLDTQGGTFGTLDSLQETFHKIHCVTGEEDLHKLVGTFIQIEDKNFALLNFVNEQNNEAETLKDEINQIRCEMEVFSREERRQHEERRAVLRGVSVQQQATEQQVGGYQQRITSVGKILNQLKTGIDSVCHNIDCDRSVIEDKLGSSTGIRDSTIMTYLGLVERRTNELLTLQSFLSSKDLDKDYNPRMVARHLLGQSPPLPRQNKTVEPPTSGDDNDPEESLLKDQLKPLSKDELLPLVMTRMQRKAKIVRPEVRKSASKLSVVASRIHHGSLRL
ncbi:outer dynein arm-docking complex subunit 1 isoform X1 [Salmo salar]|uniref:Outer dynein arm-docking complex subunit 1 isoform X1 n=2 Tax=Salmo salar TaxID=8030 RepID=A0A1S3MER3_SALSA|nr:outer dynein arm-docking complex subunit 1-like isoform X1 [Salmo salar]|eukprot:XP_014001661.1 PREDICTED: coiled-coil domain-containing protein 114-like isoform X1 [Salmo salar]